MTSQVTIHRLGLQYWARMPYVQVDICWLPSRCKCHSCSTGAVPDKSWLWFLGFTAGQDYRLLLYLGTLHNIFWYWEAQSSERREGFRVSSSFIPPGLMSRVCGTFSNRILPSSSRKQPRAKAIVYVDWRDMFRQPTPWRDFPCFALGFS